MSIFDCFPKQTQQLYKSQNLFKNQIDIYRVVIGETGDVYEQLHSTF